MSLKQELHHPMYSCQGQAGWAISKNNDWHSDDHADNEGSFHKVTIHK